VSALLGPWGALIGAPTAAGLKRLFQRLGIDKVFDDASTEFVARQLGPREGERVRIAYEAAVKSLAQRLRDGERIRNDGFFPGADGSSEAAHQTLEGVLLKARDSHEKRKAERFGELYAWLAFNPDISASHANYLIDLAGRLTYQQLLLLSFFGADDRSSLPDWESTGSFSRLDMGLVAAIEQLGREELVVRDDNRAVATFSDVNPRQLKTVLNGRLLYEAMNLREAEREDFEEVAALLRRLGKVEIERGAKTTYRVDMIVPRGSSPEVTRVKIGQQVVEKAPGSTLGLADADDSPEENSS
jgi:hypothetical protein